MIRVRDKEIKKSCFIIAEIGINHNSDIKIARELIDAAADAGCDAVKFQAFRACRMYPKTAGKIDWKDKEKEYSYDIYDANESFEVPDGWWKELSGYAHSKRLVFFASICDEQTGDEVIEYLDMVKATSFAITHIPLLKHIASYGKPLIFSTGTATMEEIADAYDAVSGINDNIMIMHCISQYPARLEDTNIAELRYLIDRFPEAVVGFSDHSIEISDAPVAAVVNGAKIIEKHITLDRRMPGPDHFFALEPDMLRKMVSDIRKAEKAIASGKVVDVNPLFQKTRKRAGTQAERYFRSFARRSVMTTQPLRRGHLLKKEDLIVLRNANKKPGLKPEWYERLLSGKYFLNKDVGKEHPITLSDISKKGYEKLKIQLLVDTEKIWYNAYVDELVSSISDAGHDVKLIRDPEDIKTGDILFLLSCVRLLPEKKLSLNKRNIVIHASEVPKGRGWSPMTWQILQGRNSIPISLFEAESEVDSGVVYMRKTLELDGSELIDEAREKLARKVNQMAMEFIYSYPDEKGIPQEGKPTYYDRRTPRDSKLDVDKTIKEQFNLFRVVDNERYPAFFDLNQSRYVITIRKDDSYLQD